MTTEMYLRVIAKQGNNAINRDTGILPGMYKSIIA